MNTISKTQDSSCFDSRNLRFRKAKHTNYHKTLLHNLMQNWKCQHRKTTKMQN